MADITSDSSVYTNGQSSLSDSLSAYIDSQVNTSDSAPAYIEGSTNIVSSVSAFFRGFRETVREAYLMGSLSFTVNAYLRGGTEAESASTSAYLDGFYPGRSVRPAHVTSGGPASDTTIAFTYGGVAASDSTSAFINSPPVDDSSFAVAYTDGIIRSSAHCYIEPYLDAVDYIILAVPGGREKKFKILTQNYDIGTEEKAGNMATSIGGGTMYSVGAIYRTWSMIVRAKFNEERDGYGDKDDLEYFYSLNDPGSTELIFTDHRRLEHKVHIVGEMVKNLMTVSVEDDETLYFYKITLIRSSE